MSLLLIADDDANLRYSLKRMLDNKGYTFVEASDGVEAIEQVRAHRPDVVIMDVRMPRMDGLAAFEEIKRIAPSVPVIIMTAYGSTEIAIQAMKKGAFDYTLKPYNVDEMCEMIARAVKVAGQGSTTTALRAEPAPPRPHQIVGSSRAMQQVYKAIGQVAESDVPVLILGESGTGKELVARAIHEHSNRAQRSFIAINCAAIPETLIESELFGHERGAFTGAVERKIGLLQACNTGTVFLDEVIEIPLSAQAKLLRFLQEGEVLRLGSNAPDKLDVRVFAATNTDPQAAVARRLFREDLYYRLNTVTIALPPLRERLEDLEELTAYFVSRFNARYNKSFSQVSGGLLRRLRDHTWPGNVRELENVIHKAVVVGRGDVLLPEHLTSLTQPGPSMRPADQERSLEQLVDLLVDEHGGSESQPLLPTMEQLLIARVLERVQGNQVKAAKLLGISRNTLRNRIEKFDLKHTFAVGISDPDDDD
jgi:two-component system response regulator AtoC